MQRLGLALLLGAALPLGCGVLTVDQTSQPIINGVADTTDTSIVMVWGTDSGGGNFICSSTVVSPHVLLTAAHCVAPSSVGAGTTFKIFLGDSIDNATEWNDTANWVEVQETHFDPRFDINHISGGNDVAVIITKTAMSLKPIPINRAALVSAQKAQPTRLVGYGINNSNDTSGRSAGTRRQTTTTLTDFDDSFLYFYDSQHNTCHGDSGGPELMTLNGYEQIIGVTSFDTVAAGGVQCTLMSTDTRVDGYLWFIDPYIQQFDPTWQPPDLYFKSTDLSVFHPDMAIDFVRTGGCSVGAGNSSTGNGAIFALALLALVAIGARRRRS